MVPTLRGEEEDRVKTVFVMWHMELNPLLNYPTTSWCLCTWNIPPNVRVESTLRLGKPRASSCILIPGDMWTEQFFYFSCPGWKGQTVSVVFQIFSEKLFQKTFMDARYIWPVFLDLFLTEIWTKSVLYSSHLLSTSVPTTSPESLRVPGPEAVASYIPRC